MDQENIVETKEKKNNALRKAENIINTIKTVKKVGAIFTLISSTPALLIIGGFITVLIFFIILFSGLRSIGLTELFDIAANCPEGKATPECVNTLYEQSVKNGDSIKNPKEVQL